MHHGSSNSLPAINVLQEPVQPRDNGDRFKPVPIIIIHLRNIERPLGVDFDG